MSNPFLLDLQKKINLPLTVLEDKWEKAKQITSEDFGIDISEFSNKEWSYTMDILKKDLNINEKAELHLKFLNSDKKSRDFIKEEIEKKKTEDAQVSTSLGHISSSLNQIIPPSEEKEKQFDKGLKEGKQIFIVRPYSNESKYEIGDEIDKQGGGTIKILDKEKLDDGNYKITIENLDELKIQEKEETDPSLKPPKEWWDKMIADIGKEKTVDNPEAVVGKIWSDLSDDKKSEIRGREGKTYGPAKQENIMSEEAEVKEAIDGNVIPTVDIPYRVEGGEKTEPSNTTGLEDNKVKEMNWTVS